MFDVIYISYDEPNADDNWEKLLDIAPHALRVHGVKGIANAHIEAAKKVNTDHFFTVDGDNIVDEKFNWGKIPDFLNNDQRIHVWRCKNPVNGLVYGYGGVKLWPTNHVENIKEFSVDFTTSVATHGFKIQNSVASTTMFNTSEYDAWKSGFRECSKLVSGTIHNADKKSLNRLMAWLSVGADVEYGYYCILGARMGALNGIKKSQNEKDLFEINDFEKCKEIFETIAGDPSVKCLIHEYGVRVEKELNRKLVLYTESQSRQCKEFMYDL